MEINHLHIPQDFHLGSMKLLGELNFSWQLQGV